MATIRQQDFIQSIADAFQHISYYHPPDFIRAMAAAYEREQSPAARNAIAQILVNSRLCAEGRRPICQDTGMAVVFLKIGMGVRWDATLPIEDMVNAGVRRAYNDRDNPLRASILTDPAFGRLNTRDNTPAVVHMQMVAGDTVDVTVAAKGFGSENKSRMKMLTPAEDIVEYVLNEMPSMGADWCPPGMLGIGIGGTTEKAALLAKEALMEPVDMHDLKARGPRNKIEELRITLLDRVNALGIGAQGLGGLTTVLDIKIRDYPTHAASKPVAIIPNCAATRHAHFVLDGSGPAQLEPPDLALWPKIALGNDAGARRVNLDTLTRDQLTDWKAGERLLLSGKLLTGRDAAHQRMAALIARGEPLPVSLRNRFIFYVGPVDPVRDEAVGPAGPTTSSRMDPYTEMLLEKAGLIGMIGKSERGAAAIASIRRHGAVYCVAIGGAAYLVSKAIRASRVLAFEDLGMEAMREFEVRDMPVTLAVDTSGTSVHQTGPAQWRSTIGGIRVAIA